MKTHKREPPAAPQDAPSRTTLGPEQDLRETCSGVTRASPACTSDHAPVRSLPNSTDGKPDKQGTLAHSSVARGISGTHSSTYLQRGIWLRVLITANRFRVIRTIDVAVCCFAERPYKAALTAAQRAVRGLVKANFLRRYRTDRFQVIYGITQAGVDWLGEAGFDAASSVRRVSDMTNPEHRLWAQFIVLASEARGLRAMTEQELLRHLNRDASPDGPIQGLLRVQWKRGTKVVEQQLRPDAVAIGADGLTAWEIDRSKRGADRESALAAEVMSVGRIVKTGDTLRRVAVLCKTDRIRKRAIAVVERLAAENNAQVLVGDRCHFRKVDEGTYEVWRAEEKKLRDGRTKVADVRAGWVIIQLLPTWLPKVRIDSTNKHSMAGWFGENYLPYRRPASLPCWPSCASPLLKPLSGKSAELPE